MILSLAQRWDEMLRRSLEMRPGPQGLIVERKIGNVGSTPVDDDQTDLVVWAKRVGEADIFS